MTTKMTKRAGLPPALNTKKNRSGNTCYATFNGCKVWFGREDDAETRVRYASYVAAWEARGRRPEPEEQTDDVTVRELVERRRQGIEEQKGAAWFDRNGVRLRLALQPLLDAHGPYPAAEFSSADLEAIRHGMIQGGTLCGEEINARIAIIKAAFRWAVPKKLVPASVWGDLAAVTGLGAGDFGTRGSRPRKPVAGGEATVWATLEELHPINAALVELLWWTAARPAEIFNLCPQDIVKRGAAWYAEPAKHKTTRFGKRRFLGFGPKTQEILRRFLDRVPKPAANRPLFSPKLGMAAHQHERAEARQTPLYGAARERSESSRDYGDIYTADVLRTAIGRAVDRVNRNRITVAASEFIETHGTDALRVILLKHNATEIGKLAVKHYAEVLTQLGGVPLPSWTPYQLRHSALTRIRRERGQDTPAVGEVDAAMFGGHMRKTITDHYTGEAILDRVLVIAAAVA